MRGTLVQSVDAERGDGIIPAYAGNTKPICPISRPCRDHPRICGEHLCPNCLCTALTGSSPHMRGTPVGMPSASRLVGIIPAYAGNTVKYSGNIGNGRDHPRICGEHPSARDVLCMCLGSSPHMRGTRRDLLNHAAQPGIIPAYAGNTE